MIGKRIAIALGTLVALLLSVVIVLAYADFDNTFRVHDPFDITDPTCPYDAGMSLDDADWWAWKIVPDANWQVSGMELYISCCYGSDPAPSSPIAFEIYTGTAPFQGTVIASGLFTGSVTDYDNYPNIDTFTITLSSPAQLAAGITYWFALSSNADSASNKVYHLYNSPAPGSGCTGSTPAWLLEEQWCDPSTNPPTCYLETSDVDMMPFAVVGQLAGGTPTPTPTPTVKATSTPQATPTPVGYVEIYAAEVITPELRAMLIVHYNP